MPGISPQDLPLRAQVAAEVPVVASAVARKLRTVGVSQKLLTAVMPGYVTAAEQVIQTGHITKAALTALISSAIGTISAWLIGPDTVEAR